MAPPATRGATASRLSQPTGCGRSCARASAEVGAALCRANRLARPRSRAQVAPEFREPQVRLWLGRDAHLVHYPVKAGRLINVVAITTDSWNAPGWSEPANPAELIPRLTAEGWTQSALAHGRPARKLG